jgi:uncharacterized protein (DUF1501 family)
MLDRVEAAYGGRRGMSRRAVLKAGLASLINLSWARETGACESSARADTVILIWLDGGPSHLDTFDPKPDAPRQFRGDFSAIRTSAPGVYLSELLPRMAKVMHRVTLVRTLSHEEESHERACHRMLTGHPAQTCQISPSIGSVAASVWAARTDSPVYAVLPASGFAFGFGRAGSLPQRYDPWTPDDDTVRFALRQEPQRVVERYGYHAFGRRCLLARRLTEQGVRFVAICQDGWDTHSDNAQACRDWLAPPLDQGLSALIEDLHQRGRLSRTLVVCLGEFGRSPKINALAGRDHWSRCGFALLCGAGVPGGQVIGKSDSIGAEPLERPVTPQEIAAAIYARLGIPLARGGLPEGAVMPELG